MCYIDDLSEHIRRYKPTVEKWKRDNNIRSYTLKELEKFYDDRGFMQPYGENGSLFAVIGMVIAGKTNDYERVDYQTLQAVKAINSVFDGNDITYGDEKNSWSHDNHTGLVSGSKLMGLDLEKRYRYKDYKRRLHPRDIGYYLALKFPILAFLFLIPTKIAMIESCATNYKYRPDFLLRLRRGQLFPKLIKEEVLSDTLVMYHYKSWFGLGGEFSVRRFLKTDGKLLAWLRFNTIDMPLTKVICTWCLKRNENFNGWKRVFEIYYGLEHPNSTLTEEQYNE